MARPKTISDDEVLRVARELFREKGHTASTRAVAEAAGISEAILYQRFNSKDELFFRAMHSTGPDLEEILGPDQPIDDAREYLCGVVVRAGKHFVSVIPLGLQVMMHPSFNRQKLGPIGGPNELKTGLIGRLESLVKRKRMAVVNPAMAARLLLSVAHDWALGQSLRPGPAAKGISDLEELFEVVWMGLRGK